MTSDKEGRVSGGALLEVASISKRFGGLHVFTDVSFSIPPGEVLGVIGPNGAGKTTLINVICGMLPPTGGGVRLDGKAMTGKPLHVISRMGIVEEECDESLFWMEMLADNGVVKPTRLRVLMQEGNELLAIVVSSAKTARASRTA